MEREYRENTQGAIAWALARVINILLGLWPVNEA
jgi:hypothetical protein